MHREVRSRLIGPRTLKTALAFLVVFWTYDALKLDFDPTLACYAIMACMEGSIRQSASNGLDRILGTLIGSALGYIYVLLQPGNVYLCSLIIAAGVALIIAFSSLVARPGFISLGVAAYINLCIFYNATTASATWYVMQRTIGTLYGIAVALLINRFLFNPRKYRVYMTDGGHVFRLNGAHYVQVGDEPVLITNEKYSYSFSLAPGENPDARTALHIMLACAQRDGVDIKVLSGYRPYSEQRNRFNKKIPSADKHLAHAGHSEHSAGLAYDLGSGTAADFTDRFETTEQYKWLAENAPYYGFIERYPRGKTALTGYEFEPWHYRYVGPKTALFLKKESTVLEDYIVADEDGKRK